MAFNERELDAVMDAKLLAQGIYDKIQEAEEQNTRWAKEFASGQSNDLSAHAADLAALGLDYSKLNVFFNQVCAELVSFRDGVAVGTRDRNKDIVEVALD